MSNQWGTDSSPFISYLHLSHSNLAVYHKAVWTYVLILKVLFIVLWLWCFRAILETFTPDRIVSIPGISSVLDGLQAYTLRHFSRINRIIQSSFLVDYTLSSMNVLIPEDNKGSNLLDASKDSPELVVAEAIAEEVPSLKRKHAERDPCLLSSTKESDSGPCKNEGSNMILSLNLSTSSDLEEISTDEEMDSVQLPAQTQLDKMSGQKRKGSPVEC